MLYTRASGGTVQKIEAMKTAVGNFIDSVEAMSPTRKISIVIFAVDETDKIGDDTYEESGLFYSYTYNYTQIVNGLTTVNTAGVTELKAAVNGLKAAGATSADSGMNRAAKA